MAGKWKMVRVIVPDNFKAVLSSDIKGMLTLSVIPEVAEGSGEQPVVPYSLLMDGDIVVPKKGYRVGYVVPEHNEVVS